MESLGAEEVLVGMGRPEFGRTQLEIILGGGDCQTGFEGGERLEAGMEKRLEGGSGAGEEGLDCPSG